MEDRVGAKNIIVVAAISTVFVILMDYAGLTAWIKKVL